MPSALDTAASCGGGAAPDLFPGNVLLVTVAGQPSSPAPPPPCCRRAAGAPTCQPQFRHHVMWTDLADPHVIPSHSPYSEGPSFRKGTVLPELLPLLPGSASEGDVCRPTAGPGWQAAAWDTLPAVTSCGGSGGSSSLASCGVNRKRGCVRTVAVSCERRGRPWPPL